MAAEDWESERACLRLGEPGMWDLDSGTARHAKAARICRNKCPVREQCEKQIRREARLGRRIQGLYAGLIWSPLSAEGMDVAEWHTKARGKVSPSADLPFAGAGTERHCVAPGCVNTFVLKPRGLSRIVCSKRCGERRKRAIDARTAHQ